MWPPLYSNTALTLSGMEFTRASQVATWVLFHYSMTTSRSWWMLETLRSSTFRLRMPHKCSIGFRSRDMVGQSITFTLSFFSKAVPVIMLEYCPAAQSPKGGDHALLQYVTVHVGIHGSLNELILYIYLFIETVCQTMSWSNFTDKDKKRTNNENSWKDKIIAYFFHTYISYIYYIHNTYTQKNMNWRKKCAN